MIPNDQISVFITGMDLREGYGEYNSEIEKLKFQEKEMASLIKRREKEFEIKNSETRKNFDDRKKEKPRRIMKKFLW